ncbi:MAG: glycerol-3-phosphate acyltransferase [Lachnospiraceae bacterium]|nr:glycerol-3-phosphate acyltransferase [Lachnospiraceae bacterium]
MGRLISLLIGYAFGNFLTAEVVSRKASGNSVFNIGTGNPGMANIVNQYGAVVFAGDLLKIFIPCLVCRVTLFPKLGATAAAYART